MSFGAWFVENANNMKCVFFLPVASELIHFRSEYCQAPTNHFRYSHVLVASFSNVSLSATACEQSMDIGWVKCAWLRYASFDTCRSPKFHQIQFGLKTIIIAVYLNNYIFDEAAKIVHHVNVTGKGHMYTNACLFPESRAKE